MLVDVGDKCLTILWRELGKDHEEGRAEIGMHGMQVQDAAVSEALQAVRPILHLHPCIIHTDHDRSFELGGEKKTKGAALQFMRTRPLTTVTTRLISSFIVIVSLLAVLVVSLRPHCLSTLMPRTM